jgi:nucleoside-diphosphate kinase
MSKEQTLSIIKPDAVSANHIGAIISRFEKSGLKIVAAKMVHLTPEQAKAFYAVHAHRPFFQELVTFMIEGPVFVMVLEGDHAVAKNRDLMGATNPKEAAPGTIRFDLAKSIERNAVHGSDSLENAKKEIAFFFKQQEIFSR